MRKQLKQPKSANFAAYNHTQLLSDSKGSRLKTRFLPVFAALALLSGPFDLRAITVDDSYTDQQLAEMLAGPGVTVANVSYTGVTHARGAFADGIASGLPMDSGVILSTGDITFAPGPNDSTDTGVDNFEAGDADLDLLVSGSTQD